MSFAKDSVDLRWPVGAVRALVEYDPASTEITHATPGDSQDAVEARIESGRRCVVLERTVPCAGVINQKVEIGFQGRFRNPRVTFFRVRGCGMDSQAERRERTYRAREAWCKDKKDEVQNYFFELDSNTHADFIDFVVANPREAEFRKKAVRDVMNLCWRRIVGRYRGGAPDVGPEYYQPIPRNSPWPDPADDPRERVEHLSHVFHEASLKFNGDQSKVRTAMEKFAAGKHRLELPVPGLAQKEILTEPDSSNVFLFAEFAFLCIRSGVDVETWSFLLPSLVKMQALFVFRIPTRCQIGKSVRSYDRTPEFELHKDEWDRIEKIYAPEFLNFDIVRLGRLMGVNLYDLGPSIE